MRVLVVGTGLLGASAGLGLRAAGHDVALHDPSPTALALARDLGAGRPAEPGDEHDAVVVAAPPDVTAAVALERLAGHPSAVVTDVASVKAVVVDGVRRGGGDLSRLVAGHPMAGRERSGAAAARGDLFVGRPWVLAPTEETSGEALAAVRSLVLDLGATPVVMDAAAHDEAVAVVSHVPQVAASLVAARLRTAPESAVALAGQGLRDVTRIAASDPLLWAQILRGNAPRVAAQLRALRDDLDALLDGLESGRTAELARAVAAGQEGHARIPGKHGAAPTAYAVVTVVVPDSPGELARLLADVGEVGVNLEDLHLEHSPGQPVGLAEVSVLPGSRARLEEALRARGWSVPS